MRNRRRLSDNISVRLITCNMRDSQSHTNVRKPDYTLQRRLGLIRLRITKRAYFFCDGASLETPLATTSTCTYTTYIRQPNCNNWSGASQPNVFILAPDLHNSGTRGGAISGDGQNHRAEHIDLYSGATCISHEARQAHVVVPLTSSADASLFYLPGQGFS